MAVKWTSVRNERLLLLIVKNIKVDANKLAQAWAEQYGDDEFQPTARAITEQFGALKRKAGAGGGSATTANGASTPKTSRTKSPPNKPKATPKSASKTTTPSKRKKAADSDDGESNMEDDDSELDIKNLPRAISRASLARTTKVLKRYEESGSEDEKADDESELGVKREVNRSLGEGEEVHVAVGKKSKVSRANGDVDSVMGDLMTKDGPSTKKKARKASVEMDESDVSDFEKTFG